MTIETLKAWLIHKKPSGESSMLCIFFTEKKGILYAKYKGAQKLSKQSSLTLFTPLTLHLNQRYQYYVQSVEPGRPLLFEGIHLLAGLYLNELIYRACKPEDGCIELFNAYEHTLYTMNRLPNTSSAIQQILRHFEWSLIKAMGYGHTLEKDIQNEIICSDEQYQFLPGQGFVKQKKGLLRGEHILAFSRGDILNKIALHCIKHIMRLALTHALEGKTINARLLIASRSFDNESK